jgi:hypothetical protein
MARLFFLILTSSLWHSNRRRCATERKLSPELARELVIKYGGMKPASRNSPYSFGTIQRQYNMIKENSRKRVFCFSDNHVSPDLATDSLFHIAKWIKVGQPDYVLAVGDFADFNSLNGHDANDTKKGQSKPSIKRDLEHFDLCVKIITENSERHDIVFCEGNHEGKRIRRYENEQPEMHEFIMDAYMGTLKTYKWRYVPFGRYYNLEGVDFTHVPLNSLSKPVGGKNALRNVAMYSVRDIVFGHTHNCGMITEAKFGMNERTRVVNLGTAMPHGFISEYAIDGQSGGWTHNVCELVIQDGRIQDVSFVSMETLAEKFV